ncbi:MAG: hypothetical protein P4L49_14255 [Desulfosporosinus sp.]|nr:hypothetical protein [Desulfosporosinus sp.]
MRLDKQQRMPSNSNSPKKSFTLENVDEFFSVSLFVARTFQLFSALSIIWSIVMFARTHDFTGLLLFFLGSFAFFTNAWNVDKTKEYRAIITIITTTRIRSIDKIAEIVKLPYNSVRKDLQNMVNKIRITDLAIDDARREVVLT